jgi:hypothetical protein
MALYQLQKAGEALSVMCLIMGWKIRLLFAAANDFSRGQNGCSVKLTHTFIQY